MVIKWSNTQKPLTASRVFDKFIHFITIGPCEKAVQDSVFLLRLRTIGHFTFKKTSHQIFVIPCFVVVAYINYSLFISSSTFIDNCIYCFFLFLDFLHFYFCFD